MLTKELLNQNETLKGLSDEQMAAICKLSENDEATVIAKKFSETWNRVDETTERITGIKRNGDEKSYLYNERALNTVVARNADLAKEIETLNGRLKDAENKPSGNDETAKALEQAQKDLEAVRKQYNDLNTKYADAEKNFNAELLNVKIENELKSASAGVRFKKELPQSVVGMILNDVYNKVKGLSPEFIDNGNGGKVLAFHDETGALLRNPENQLNPFSASELIMRELKTMDVLANERKQTGGGTQTPTGAGASGGNVVSIVGAKTQNEAYDVIANSLMAQGLTIGSNAFDDAMATAWKDNNVTALPQR